MELIALRLPHLLLRLPHPPPWVASIMLRSPSPISPPPPSATAVCWGPRSVHPGLPLSLFAPCPLGRAQPMRSSPSGIQVSAPVDLPEHGVTTVFVELDNAKLELLHPLGNSSPIAAFLERHPAGGMHHLCLEVADVHAAVSHVSASTRVLNKEPKIGAHGKPVVFLHPKDHDGVLVELEQV